VSTPRERRRIAVGHRVRVDGTDHIVIGVTGPRVRLAADTGAVLTVTVVELLTDPRFELVDARVPVVARPEVGLEGLPAAAAQEASWWEAHIVEVVYGLPPDAPRGARPKPQYDPERTSLTARERAKAAELSAAGRPVTDSCPSGKAHKRQRSRAEGCFRRHAVLAQTPHRVGY
jgi:hypothetical protein